MCASKSWEHERVQHGNGDNFTEHLMCRWLTLHRHCAWTACDLRVSCWHTQCSWCVHTFTDIHISCMVGEETMLLSYHHPGQLLNPMNADQAIFPFSGCFFFYQVKNNFWYIRHQYSQFPLISRNMLILENYKDCPAIVFQRPNTSYKSSIITAAVLCQNS